MHNSEYRTGDRKKRSAVLVLKIDARMSFVDDAARYL